MNYREHPVPAGLRRHLRCVWRLREPRPAGASQTIYPDGHCELIVHLKAPPRCWDARNGWHQQAATLFAAQRVTAVRLEVTRPLDCVGLRLTPAASNLLSARGLQESRDRVVDLAGVDRALSNSLRAAVRAFAGGDDARLWRFMERRVDSATLDERIETAVERFIATAGKARIDATASSAGMSMRGFQIRFRQCVGLTPKEFARLMRLQATLRALDGSDTRISELAADTGFADQAHATRELRLATGLTPARLRAELRRDRDGDVAVRLAAAFVRGYSD
jgi:AraC-like DNA-binding protein